MTLAARIADHRHLYQADLLIPKLVSRQPPTSLDLNTGELHQEPAAAIGMTMSGRLLKYVGHPEGYGGDFPWSKALWLLRRECRAKHSYHRAHPAWRGSLCWQFVTLTVVAGFSVQNAARILRYDDPEPVLRWAFDYIERAIDDLRAKAERREREVQGHGPGALPPYTVEQRHDQPGMHRLDCPKCRKEDAA